MKKIYSIVLCLCILFSFPLSVYAQEGEIDSSTPRLMVIEYQVKDDCVMPNSNTVVTIKFKNQSKNKTIKNIRLGMTEESGEIKPVGMGTKYVDIIKANGTYVWELEVTASKLANIGEHNININAEYEDENSVAYSSSDSIRLNVHQTVNLDYDGAKLPVKVHQGDTVSVGVNLMNTGKTQLSNCKIIYDVEGLDSGGVVFVGTIPVGESMTGTANLRVSSELLGEVKGTITISYDDPFGNTNSKTVDVSTTIEEKVVSETADEETQPKNPQWWAYLLGGLILGGMIGCSIPIAINNAKQRKEDEKRL